MMGLGNFELFSINWIFIFEMNFVFEIFASLWWYLSMLMAS